MGYSGRTTKLLLAATLATALSAGAASNGTPPDSGPAINEALVWLKSSPRFDAQYDFAMTVRIRLLLFWISRDDVGGGYIRVGKAAGDSNLEVIKLLFGSDPARAHGINRWGAGTEVAQHGKDGAVESSAFLGFMKSSQGQSVGAMRQELSSEKAKGQHRFEAIISRVDPGRAVSVTVPFYSDKDFEFRDFGPAEGMVLDRLQQSQDRKFHTLEGASLGCARSGGFLSTVRELSDHALAGDRLPISLCYVYNAKRYTISLESTHPVPEKTVQFTFGSPNKQTVHETYHNLQEARFQIVNHTSGEKSNFTVLLGTGDGLRGTPLQINYQPNWWFQITLNLKPQATAKASGR